MKPVPSLSNPYEALKKIMSDLRDPNGGCPWDLEQTHKSISKNLIEEAYEALEALDNFKSGDKKTADHFKEELGDLLLQVALHAQIASESNDFNLDDVILYLSEKLIFRHPHVFGDAPESLSSKEVLHNWELLKAQEKEKKAEQNTSILGSVPRHLPALLRAEKLGKKAARVGFDWPKENAGPLLREKIQEELEEFLAELPDNPADFTEGVCGINPDQKDRAEEELGDLLFAISQWARHYGIDPEKALQVSNEKFIRRFNRMEEKTADRLAKGNYPDWQEWERIYRESRAELLAEGYK